MTDFQTTIEILAVTSFVLIASIIGLVIVNEAWSLIDSLRRDDRR